MINCLFDQTIWNTPNKQDALTYSFRPARTHTHHKQVQTSGMLLCENEIKMNMKVKGFPRRRKAESEQEREEKIHNTKTRGMPQTKLDVETAFVCKCTKRERKRECLNLTRMKNKNETKIVLFGTLICDDERENARIIIISKKCKKNNWNEYASTYQPYLFSRFSFGISFLLIFFILFFSFSFWFPLLIHFLLVFRCPNLFLWFFVPGWLMMAVLVHLLTFCFRIFVVVSVNNCSIFVIFDFVSFVECNRNVFWKQKKAIL